MPESFKLIPKNIGAVLQTQFVLNAGQVTGFIVGYEVNYGQMSLPFQVDIWDSLTAQQKNFVQQLYDKLLSKGAEIIASSQ